ncbi:short-chain dehydrogenase [Symbiobacterium thermophilum]|uniref:short-chain dehydrogenase n=1 Tax=Symbiobacterium thermophilum TaxID=2734 RepID=UPI0035C74C91
MHALVVGGTGMLREATLALTRSFTTVSVVARRADAMPGRPAGINPVPVDYHDTGALAQALRRAIGEHGPVRLAVCWIHSTAPEALGVVAAEIGRGGEPCRLFHVRGSAAADPTRLPRPALEALPPNVAYRQVILGFQIEGERSRWLTHGEISQGVLQAIADDAEYHVVGVVRPWERRP